MGQAHALGATNTAHVKSKLLRPRLISSDVLEAGHIMPKSKVVGCLVLLHAVWPLLCRRHHPQGPRSGHLEDEQISGYQVRVSCKDNGERGVLNHVGHFLGKYTVCHCQTRNAFELWLRDVGFHCQVLVAYRLVQGNVQEYLEV